MFSRGIVAAMEDDSKLKTNKLNRESSQSAVKLYELVAMERNIKSGLETISSAFEDFDVLCKYNSIMQKAQADKNFQKDVFKTMSISTEEIYNRLGISDRKNLVALENFSNEKGLERQLSIAIEENESFLKRVWKAIVKAFEDFVAFIKKFFFKKEEAFKAAEEKTEFTAEHVDKAVGSPKNNSVTVKKAADLFGDDTLKNIDLFLDQQQLRKFSSDTVHVLENEIATLISDASDANIKQSYRNVKFAAKSGVEEKMSAPDFMKWIVIVDFISTRYVDLVPSRDRSSVEALYAYGMSKITDVKEKLQPKDYKRPTLTIDQMKSLTEKINSYYKFFKEDDCFGSNFVKKTEKILQAIRKTDFKANPNDSREQKKITAFNRALTGLYSSRVSGITQIQKGWLLTKNGVEEYINISLKEYNQA